MAFHEQPRENLIRDAVAYEKRILLQVAGFDELVFWGQRTHGGWSFYYGEDPVFQFNGSSELRRAFVNGVHYAARDGRLFKLSRETRGGKVEMNWQFDVTVEKEIGEKCLVLLRSFANELKMGGVTVIESVPSDSRSNNLMLLADCLGQTETVVRIAKDATA
jgi:hypothetical protein